jgi:hypothetical protein
MYKPFSENWKVFYSPLLEECPQDRVFYPKTVINGRLKNIIVAKNYFENEGSIRFGYESPAITAIFLRLSV